MKELKTDAESLQSCVSVSVTDLRVGNLVSVGKNALHYQINCEQIFEIEEIKKDTIHFKGFFAGEYFKDLKPILLTEEWLLKFGFTQCENEYWFEKDILSLNIIGTINIQGRKLSEAVINSNVKTVHQLQNLYYALIGSELQSVDLTEH